MCCPPCRNKNTGHVQDVYKRQVEEREVYLEEVNDFAECGLCGTAAVILSLIHI